MNQISNRFYLFQHSNFISLVIPILNYTFDIQNNEKMKKLIFLFISLLFVFAGCHYPAPNTNVKGMKAFTKDSLTYLYKCHYTFNTNFEVSVDSIRLACLPIEGDSVTIHKGDRVVVADFAIHPNDAKDTLWVKLAHSEETQGWLYSKDIVQYLTPTDSISQFIHFFSDTHAVYFIAILMLFIIAYFLRLVLRKRISLVFFQDIDSLYPIFLCFLMAFAATLYETMQKFAPSTWQHFYFNPTLSPFHVPPILSVFLLALWLFIIISVAVLDDIFRQLRLSSSFFYLLGLLASCVFCYFFFILATSIYVGYLFLLIFFFIFCKRALSGTRVYHYRCGKCGQKIKTKGKCPYCGAINE